MPGERKASTNSHPYPPYQSLDRPGKHTVRDECGRVSLALSLDSTHRGFSAMLHPETGLIATPPTKEPPAKDLENMEAAIQQARLGLEEGGIPIGGALFTGDGKLLGAGRNKRIQEGSPTKHGEIDCLENVGRLPASGYRDCTMYTTLSPCTMCSGAIILFGIRRVVMGENTTFVGGEDILISRGVEIVNLDSAECKDLMAKFVQAKPEIWNEDICEE